MIQSVNNVKKQDMINNFVKAVCTLLFMPGFYTQGFSVQIQIAETQEAQHVQHTQYTHNTRETQIIQEITPEKAQSINFSANVANASELSHHYFLMNCDGNNDIAILTVNLFPDTIRIHIPKADIYSIIFSFVGDSATIQHDTIRIEKRFNFSDIVNVKLNNLFYIKNNPESNGEYSFIEYRWYKNDTLLENETSQYYSVGTSIYDSINSDDIYYVELLTSSGKWLQTCPSTLPVTVSYAAPFKVYPNPVSGSFCRVDGVNSGARAEIFNATGYKIAEKVVGSDATIQLPYRPGIYYLRIDGKTIKVIKQ